MSETTQRGSCERKRLLRIAKLLEAEAKTWRDGFAAWDGTSWNWPKTEEWAQVRYLRLQCSAEFLRELAGRRHGWTVAAREPRA